MCLYLYSLSAYPVTTVKQDITVQAITSKHISTITALLFCSLLYSLLIRIKHILISYLISIMINNTTLFKQSLVFTINYF